MSRFTYEIVAKSWGTGGVEGAMRNPNLVTVHHSAVKGNVAGYNIKSRLISYTAWHRKQGDAGLAYHFVIPMDRSQKIYVTNWLSGFTWHNANYDANQHSIAVLVDGNFQVEKPTKMQLRKLKQLLDDIQNNWFTKNGWFSFETKLNPQDPNTLYTYKGISVPCLHGHQEVAIGGASTTACPGLALLPKVTEYRNKKGLVDWDGAQPPVIDPCEKCKGELEIVKRDNVALSNRIEQYKADCRKKEAEKTELQNKLDKADHVIKTQEEIINSLTSEKDELAKKLDVCNGEIPKLKSQINVLKHTLQETADKLSECEARQTALSKFIKAIIKWFAELPKKRKRK